MSIKFCSNSISMNPGNFSDFVEKLNKKNEKKEVVKTASVKEVVKTAEKKDEGKTSGQPQAEAKLVNCPKKETGTKGGKADNTPAKSSGQPEAEAKLVNCPKVEGKSGKSDKKEKKVEKKEATVKASFIKIAKLDAKTKTWLRDYWKALYPADYVEAMLADK